ncbi:MAG: THUMP domain-containing protein [Candidatus Odinarchaeota archaeon]
MLTVNDEFNILISCRRFQEAESCQELRRIIEDDPNLGTLEWCKLTGISCLVVGKISIDAHEFVKKLNQIVQKMPWIIKDLMKIYPIDLVVDSTVKGIRAGSKKLAKGMTKTAKFRVNLNRRDTGLDRDKLLHEIATQFPGKVDLETYDWVVDVEILGPVTGLALLREDEIVTLRHP